MSQPSPLTGMINTGNPLEDPNRTIIATNVAYMGEREDLLEIAKDLVSKLELEEPVTVLAAALLKGRFGKPGLVKISFATLQEKIFLYCARKENFANTIHTNRYSCDLANLILKGYSN